MTRLTRWISRPGLVRRRPAPCTSLVGTHTVVVSKFQQYNWVKFQNVRFVVAVSTKPLSDVNNSRTNDADAAAADYNVDEDEDDDDSDDSDDDFACSDSDDSEVKSNKKKVEAKTGRGRGQTQKTTTNQAAAGTKTKCIYCATKL